MLVVFDLDGTLIDGYAGIHEALAYAMRRLEREPLPPETVRRLVGRGLDALLNDAVGKDLAPRGVALYRERYAQVADEMTTLLPDVVPVLESLSASGHRMAVASNKPPDFTRRILESKGIAKFFDAVGGPGQDVPPKPHPAMLDAIRAATHTPPENTVVVGDMEIDAELAHAGGCASVLVPGGSRSGEELALVPSDAHLSGLSELPEWLASHARALETS